MQDLKRQSNRRPVIRKLRSSPMTVRKSRSNPIPGLSIKLRKTNSEPGFSNYWLPSYFVKNEPAFLRKKIRLLVNKFFGIIGLVSFLWLCYGTIWTGKTFFNLPIKKVFIEGENLLSMREVLKASKIQPGKKLYSVKPYNIIENLQNHPTIHNADIRLKFPDKIYLFINEYRPIAVIKIFKSNSSKEKNYLLRKNFFLIGDHQRLIKKMSTKQILNTNYKELPLISGIKIKSIEMGSCLNSPILERSLEFLKIFKNNIMEFHEIEHKNLFENGIELTNLNYKNIHIDVSDPLNLKINWPEKTSRFIMDPLKTNPQLPFTIQMGSRKFDERFRTFKNIYPVLYKKHPHLKSIDLRYKNKVMLIPY